jgi:hemoglobin-like flavoprotein
MDTHATLERMLALVVERIGDPAPQVYEHLFAAAPELREMFVMDTLGSARGEMFYRAVEALLDLAADQPYAPGLIAAEWSNHRMNGVTQAQFVAFFEAMGAVFREALGHRWSPEVASAWAATMAKMQRITTPAA